MATVCDVNNAGQFDNILDNTDNLIVVHFSADWAPQCAQINEVLQTLATEFAQCSFVKIEAESVPDLSLRYDVTAVPTCKLLKNRGVVDTVNGANVPELTKKVKQHATTRGPLPTPAISSVPKQDLNTRLKQLINSAPVILFMKGTPSEPRCGFSRQTIQILGEHHVTYSTFDILGDEEVRQGLKTFSNWPTYPQLYVKGELLGGLDIIKEMVESGEFKDSMPKTESLNDRLKRLIHRENVMLFMKGDPTTPRCGFSRTTIGILADTGVQYGTFDILSDEDVRQGLKAYSNWPTYPQLYVNGQLVGGLDIIKELKESGELENVLKDAQ